MRMLMSSGPPVAMGPSTQELVFPRPPTLWVGKKKFWLLAREPRGAGCPFPRRRPGWEANFSKRPFLPAPFLVPTRYSAPHSEPGPLAQPPISGACAPGPGRDRSPGRPSSRFFPAPASLPPGATATRGPGPRREEDTHLVGVTCCPGPARESPPGPGARRGPQPGQAAPAPHPRPAPAAAAAGREGGRDRLLLRKFQERCGPQCQTVSWIDCSPIPVSAGCSTDRGTKKRLSSCMGGPVE
ncbi:translation initiation factor IF-2-like [Peromyscus californicus insignis]|uniref:translation initiation factor IF-2-like n=1 Tax=Peromyscus californicus insignis TaxID=564181 RepID=UPI0022A6B54B|nr:translation initiation factor IF-2-like [Peromyscus californicus insignis]